MNNIHDEVATEADNEDGIEMITLLRAGCGCCLARVYLSPRGWLVRTNSYRIVVSETGWGEREPGRRTVIADRRAVHSEPWLLPHQVEDWAAAIPPQAMELLVLPVEVGCDHLNAFRPPDSVFIPGKRNQWDPQLLPLDVLIEAVGTVRATHRRVTREVSLP